MLLAALLSAVPANAEPISTAATPTSAAPAESAAPVEVNLAPVEPRDAPVEPPEADSATTETGGGDIPAKSVVAEGVTSVGTEIVASASSSATRQTKNIVSSVPSASEAVSVPVDSTSPAQQDTLVGSSVEKLQENTLPQRQVTTAVEQASRNFKAAVEKVGRDSAGTIAATTKRLTTPVAELDLLSPLSDSIPPLSLTPLITEKARPFGAAPAGPAPKLTARVEGFSQLRQNVSLLPSTAAIDLRVSLGEHLVDASNIPGATPRSWEMGLSPNLAAEAGFAGSSDERSGNPARPDLPPQATRSPAMTVGNSGGSSFAPVVALLALLALVAPTTRRRLGEVADFRAPTPFVCALERPG